MSARFLLASALLLASCAGAPSTAQAPAASANAVTPQHWAQTCNADSGWDDPGPPFRVFGNSWYVGTCGIAAILITGDEGHVLIDSGTDKGADVVAANIARLGYRIEDVELLLITHEHHDHAGGIAKLQRMSGAELAVSKEASTVLASGRVAPDDPQLGIIEGMAPARLGTVLPADGAVMLGDVSLQAIFTPGHTAGATSWRWESCEGSTCRTIVYADSMSPVSADSYRFTDHPEWVAMFRRGLANFAPVTCDMLLTPHPVASDMYARAAAGFPADPAGCPAYARAKQAALDARLAKEAAAK